MPSTQEHPTMQSPDARAGAYYVTIRSGRATILALGPFARHRRALGLVDALRQTIARAGLDPWCEYGYGTSRVRSSELCAGAFNDALSVGPDPTMRATRPFPLNPALVARVASVRAQT